MNYLILSLFFILFSLNACSSNTSPNPSQNSALNSITHATQDSKNGSMQNSLNTWFKTEWTPIVKKDKKISKNYTDENRSFTLQEYVDKAVIYHKENSNSEIDSHSKKINSMPVIGKQY